MVFGRVKGLRPVGSAAGRWPGPSGPWPAGPTPSTRCARSRCPLLVIVGEEDELATAADAEAMGGPCPTAGWRSSRRRVT